MTANAGTITDTDGDLIPDVFDNCLDDPNGPGETSHQVDTDRDGYGNLCDADFNNDGTVTGSDFTIFSTAFNSGDELTDMNGDGTVTGSDFTLFVSGFNGPPGASGLNCSDPLIDVVANPGTGCPN
jgi:hypothetical protein